jgi:hypothetical protein
MVGSTGLKFREFSTQLEQRCLLRHRWNYSSGIHAEPFLGSLLTVSRFAVSGTWRMCSRKAEIRAHRGRQQRREYTVNSAFQSISIRGSHLSTTDEFSSGYNQTQETCRHLRWERFLTGQNRSFPRMALASNARIWDNVMRDTTAGMMSDARSYASCNTRLEKHLRNVRCATDDF